MSFWDVLAPVTADITNLCTNPGFEGATTGWAASGTNTIAKSSAQSFRGNYSLLCTYNNSTTLASFSITLPTTSTDYTLIAYVYVNGNWDGGNIRLEGNSLTSSSETYNEIFTAGTSSTLKWIKLRTTLTVVSDVTGTIDLVATSVPTGGRALYLDAVVIAEADYNFETFDGDSDGCYWKGARHLSKSVFDYRTRHNGQITDFDSYSFGVVQARGMGMPATSLISQNTPLQPGSLFQRESVSARLMTLLGYFTNSSSAAGLHSLRNAWINAWKSNASPNNTPVRLRYKGSDSEKPLEIGVRYDAGMEFSGSQGFTEQVGMRLLAHDPDWYSIGEDSTVPTLQTTLTNVNNCLGRSSLGVWDNLDQGLTISSGSDEVRVILESSDNLIYFGGMFDQMGSGSAACSNIVYYDPQSDGWDNMDSGVGSGGFDRTYAIAEGPDGRIYVGGIFTQVGSGATAVNNVAVYDPSADSWADLDSGLNGTVRALVFDDDGNLYAGGGFSQIVNGSVSSPKFAKWNGSAWSAVGTSFDDNILSLAYKNQRVYAGGAFTTNGSGTSASKLAVLAVNTGTWKSVTSDTLNGDVTTIYYDGVNLLVGGAFTASGADAGLQRIARVDDRGTYQRLGLQVNGAVNSLSLTSNGVLIAGGEFTELNTDGDNPIAVDDAIAVYDGSQWQPLNADLPGTAAIYGILVSQDNSLYLGFDSSGSAVVADTFSVTNSGTANAYPIIEVDGPTSGEAKLFNISNLTTDENIWLDDYRLQSGETVEFDLRPFIKTVATYWRKSGLTKGTFSIGKRKYSILSFVRPGSDLATWHLTPGANLVFIYTDDSTVAARLRWRERYWSADGVA